jgi:hypothetical protein
MARWSLSSLRREISVGPLRTPPPETALCRRYVVTLLSTLVRIPRRTRKISRSTSASQASGVGRSKATNVVNIVGSYGARAIALGEGLRFRHPPSIRHSATGEKSGSFTAASLHG